MAYSVGQGILDKMAELGDAPQSNEEYHAGYSQAVGSQGVYVYLPAEGKVKVLPFAEGD